MGETQGAKIPVGLAGAHCAEAAHEEDGVEGRKVPHFAQLNGVVRHLAGLRALGVEADALGIVLGRAHRVLRHGSYAALDAGEGARKARGSKLGVGVGRLGEVPAGKGIKKSRSAP